MSGDEASTSARAEQKPHGEDAHAQWRDAISGASAEGEGNKKLGRRHQRRRASLYDRIEPGRRKKEARAEQIRRERDELELKDATFSPKISTYSEKLGSRRGSIEDRLLKSEFERNSTVAELRRFHKANELEECTFKPTVRSHKGKGDKISTVEMPVFGRLLATSGGKEASTSGKREEATRGRKGETSEVFDRLWEKSLAKQGGREKGKRMWRRRESILPNGAPLSPFALDLRTPQRRAKKSKDPEPLHSSEWINNLYRDASVRRKVQRSREDAIDRQILDRTTCYNMTDHSFNIMMKTVSRETMLELDRQFPNSDYVEQVGFLDVVIAFEILPPLEKLGVRHLKYLPEEELLVERLWNILATGVCDGGDNAENVVMVVPKAAFHDFMILVECCILNGNMKQEMRKIFNEQKNVENMEFWRVLETVAEVKLVNKQAYSNLRHDASSGVGEEEASLCKEVVSKKDRKSFLKFYKTQLSHPAKVKSKTDTLRAKLDAEELSHCTFAPKLYHRPKSSRRGQAVAVRKTDIVPSGTAELEKTMSKALAKPRTQKDSNPNQVTFAVLKYPNGYSKHLNRMDAPTEFDPHCFHYVPEKEKECMLSRIVFYFEFRYGGKFVSIPVHLRENPRKIALVIAKHLQIPKEAYSKLLSIVKKKMVENRCFESFEDSDERTAFTYSYAEQYRKSRGLEKPWKHLYSVFDAEPEQSYAALAEQEDVLREDGGDWSDPEDDVVGRRRPVEVSYCQKEAANLESTESQERPKERKASNDRSNRGVPGGYSEKYQEDSSFAKMILDPGFVGMHSVKEGDKRSLQAYRADLRAALLTEPPEACREHLLKAMDDLWLPVK